MIENNGKKLKSALVVLALLLTAITVIMIGNVSAAPGAFDIETTAGNHVGPLNITWETSANADWYWLNITQGPTIHKINTTNTYYVWNYSGWYNITVLAWENGDSTLAATNNFVCVNITSGTPGYDIWQGGSWGITGTSDITKLNGRDYGSKVLNTSTASLVYGAQDVDIYANFTKTGWGATTYYLYKPVYTRTSSTSHNLSWNLITKTGGEPTVTKGSDNYFEDIDLDRAGLWIISEENTAKHPDASTDTFYLMNHTIAAWFWVNASTDYVVSASPDSVKYASNDTIELEAKQGEDVIVAVFDVWNATDQTVFTAGATDVAASNQPWDFNADTDTFATAGDYRAVAYYDADASIIVYSDGPGYYYYNSTEGFGSTLTPTNYTYNFAGPWDPPEHWADPVDIEVETGVPTINFQTDKVNDTLNWGFPERMDINVTDYQGLGIDIDTSAYDPIKILTGSLTTGTYYDETAAWINNTGNGNYSIEIWAGNWTNLGGNTTYYIVFSNDTDGDGVYEWNSSKTFDFRVTQARPPVEIRLNTYTSGKIDIPAYTGVFDGPVNTVDIQFTITGREPTGVRQYYGDGPDYAEPGENIEVTGDILYPIINGTTLTDLGSGKWSAVVTPTKPGGTITISIDWDGTNNGTATETLNIINGTNVATSVEKFTVGEHINLTVTVTDMDGDLVKNANVTLFWDNGLAAGTAMNNTIGDPNEAGNGKSGEYTFWINPYCEDINYPTTAPQNITIAASWPGSGTTYWGYAKVEMEKNHNMQVTVTPTTSYAGDGTEYTININLTGGGRPDDTGLTVALYNETGVLAAAPDDWSATDEYTIEDELISLSAGTYYLFAYNDTHDSEGNNATIIVAPYEVTSSPTVLAWLIDTEMNMTFQVSPPVNGTLTLNNMSGTPNASDVGDSTTVAIENGGGTLELVNATCLGNVTYEFQPDGGENRYAEGLLEITTAIASPNPATIYTNDGATEVIITITHPATGVRLEDVSVSLDNDKNATTSLLAKIPDADMTNAQGEVVFSLTPETSGEIIIYLENGSDPNNEYVITAASRKTMTLSHEPSVDEGDAFTVTALYNGEPITDATVTITFAGDAWTTTTGVVEITAPSDLDESFDWPVVANAEGYTLDVTSLIRVINKPNIYITVTETTWTSGSKYVVKAGADNGNSYGITVTLTDASGGTTTLVTAGPDGVTFTAPTVTKETTYTLSATKTTYTPATEVTITVKPGGIPGFELITLIAAIGVAFILLRRRRN